MTDIPTPVYPLTPADQTIWNRFWAYEIEAPHGHAAQGAGSEAVQKVGAAGSRHPHPLR